MKHEHTASPEVWFSDCDGRDAAHRDEPTDFCLVCWAYGKVITRHRPGPSHHEPIAA